MCTNVAGVVPSGISPGFAGHRTLLRGHAPRVEPAVTRPDRSAPTTRMHVNLVVASPHGPPARQEHYSSVPPPVAWPQHQGG